MQGPIVQSIGLTLAINACLKGMTAGPFWPSSTIFTFCRSVRFIEPPKDPSRREARVVAEDPNAWVDRNCRSARGAWLHVVERDNPSSDRNTVGLVGGGPRWIIEIVADGSSEFWEDSWDVADMNAPDRRIWSVDYAKIMSGGSRAPEPQRSVAAVGHDLQDAFEQATRFGRVHRPDFVAAFELGLQALDRARVPSPAYHHDLAPPGLLNPDAERLLVAAQSGWVFGGMGWWNDAVFEGGVQAEYVRVSERLFSLLVEAAAVATNSSFGFERNR